LGLISLTLNHFLEISNHKEHFGVFCLLDRFERVGVIYQFGIQGHKS